jgi:hypothetical protein
VSISVTDIGQTTGGSHIFHMLPILRSIKVRKWYVNQSLNLSRYGILQKEVYSSYVDSMMMMMLLTHHHFATRKMNPSDQSQNDDTIRPIRRPTIVRLHYFFAARSKTESPLNDIRHQNRPIEWRHSPPQSSSRSPRPSQVRLEEIHNVFFFFKT